MERINWKMLIAIPLMTVCVSACGENAVQPNKKNPGTVSASASDPACQTFSVCERQAIKGDAKSQYDLAAMFDEGRCVAKSRISATYWFGNAAEKGYADAKSRRESILQALEKSAGAGDASAQYDLHATDGEADDAGNNLLVGTLVETDAPENAYVLACKNGQTAFYPAADGLKIPARKAYLQIGGAALARFIDEASSTTGITSVEQAGSRRNEFYTLQGVRTAKPAKGLYVNNGKLVIVK